jgi:hypothetical protein
MCGGSYRAWLTDRCPKRGRKVFVLELDEWEFAGNEKGFQEGTQQRPTGPLG